MNTLTQQMLQLRRNELGSYNGKLTNLQEGILNGVIDYGNNDCYALYTYTHENGTSFNLSM